MTSVPFGNRPCVLYADTFSGFGHNAMNRVFIRALLRRGYEVEAMGREGYFESLHLPTDAGLHILPLAEELFCGRPGRVAERVRQAGLLRLVAGRYRARAGYAALVLSYFDEIALSVAGMPKGTILINHSNVAGLRNPVRRFLMGVVCRHSTLVVFHEHIAAHALGFGLPRVVVEPLGFDEPFRPVSSEVLAGIDERLAAGRRFLFVPSGAKYDDPLLQVALSSRDFLDLLRAQEVLVVVKGCVGSVPRESVVAVGRHLSDAEYRALFLHSVGVILSYPRTFSHRVSAALFECFGNAKACLLSDIESFRVYADRFRYDPFFSGSGGLKEAVRRLLELPEETRTSPFFGLADLQPTFAFLEGGREGRA